MGNVFCSKSKGSDIITDFFIGNYAMGVILEGKNKNCGSKVGRVIEMYE